MVPQRAVTPKEIGRLVRETRRAQGLRQDQLAGAAGVGARFLVELEAGKPTAWIGKALAVLEALGCTLRIEPPPDLERSSGRHEPPVRRIDVSDGGEPRS